ncbi:MAG: hypothetical protein ACMXYF_03505 [Candidatus Woesearchaeota archaeon]
MKFEAQHSRVTVNAKQLQRLRPQIRNVSQATMQSDFASVCAPFDVQKLRECRLLAKQYIGVELVVLIGIGGSNLGTIAVRDALLGQNAQLAGSPQFLFADTTDSDVLFGIKQQMTQTIARKKKVLLISISKSGSTTETIANTRVFVSHLKTLQKGFEKYVVVISDKNSQYESFAKEQGFATLSISKKIGGRFSVFSAVGLFALELSRISTTQLLKGARQAVLDNTTSSLSTNIAAKNALIMEKLYKKGFVNANLFVFNSDFESIGKWFRQLIGESIGKEFSTSGRKIHCGIQPTVSVGSTDLHSLAQLYVGGPNTTYHMFLHAPSKKSVAVSEPAWNHLVSHLQNKKIQTIHSAILQGITKTLQTKKRPLSVYELHKKSEYEIGYFLQTKMIEVMYLGYLLDVNPFDQPNVEDYKNVTRKILQS